ncbi:MAG TPA: hypothetical protein VNR38_18910 [Ureibacillus sp.]|nr:hypothetical protein [Ureibacillus sp.]
MVVILYILRKTSCMLVVILVLINLVGRDVIASDSEITLKEAINIGFERAREWNEKATLISVNSVDETMGGSRGETGKRFKWFVQFFVPGTEDYLLIGISKKKITVFEPLKQSGQPTIPYDEIKLDSSDVLQLAKDKFGLKKGKDWATGYHFTLDKIDGKPILTVFGNDHESRFTRISFNAQNGEVVSAIHKMPYGGGLISKRNGDDQLTKRGMAITGVVAGNKNIVVWGDKKPTQFSMSNQPFIEWSHNNGETWTELQTNQYVTNAWFDINNQLFIATDKELYVGVTAKSKGTRILSLEHMIEKIDYSMKNHIVVISNREIYHTANQGERWELATLPKPFNVIQISDNGDLVGFTEEGKILRKTNEEWNEISMPKSNEVSFDMKVINKSLFVTTRSGFWIRNLQDGKWKKIKVDDMVVKLIKKGDKLFGITHIGAIYSISTKEEAKPKKVFDPRDLIVWDVDLKGDKLWIATIPDYSWEEMTSQPRR